MPSDDIQRMSYELDTQKLAFEKEKATMERELETSRFASTQEIERKKLDSERNKTRWTGMSILGSVTIAAASILGTAYLQNEAAKTQFALKAAEIVLHSDDPEVNANKAIRFQNLFPNRMPAAWGAKFDWTKYADENDDMKREVAKLVIEHPERKNQIIETYEVLFDEDTTVKSFLTRLTSRANSKTKSTASTHTPPGG